MTEEKNQAAPVEEKAVWEKPAMQRLDAEQAEAAGGAGNDNVVFS